MDFIRYFSQQKLLDVWSIAFLLCLSKTCMSTCPSDVQTYASNCFQEYNTHLKHMQKYDRAFFAGVDVENLRSLCDKYQKAILCIQRLHNGCSSEKDPDIDINNIISLDGEQTDVSQLCKKFKVIEEYAIVANCFLIHGEYSERCFRRAMGMNISSIKEVVKIPLNKFCSDIKSLNSCVSTNILLKCGKEAESLVDILIKANIKRSSECGQKVPLSQTSSSGTNTHNRNGQNNSNSGNSLWKNCTLHTTILSCLIFLILKHSIRL